MSFVKIFLPKQGEKSLNQHYSFIKAKWEKLNQYRPYLTDIETLKRQKEELKVDIESLKQRKELKVVFFLSALGPQYASAQILT